MTAGFRRLAAQKVPLTILMMGGTVVVTWFRGLMLYQWDTIFPFNPPAIIGALLWPWTDLVSTGVPLVGNVAMPYLAIVFALHNLFGLSLQGSQIVLYYALFTVGGLSMYYLFITQVRPETQSSHSQLGAFAAALFYMFNPYWMVYAWEIFSFQAFLYAALPLLVLFFHRGLEGTYGTPWKPILALIAITFFATPAIGNPAFSIPLILGLSVLYFIWLIDPSNSSKRRDSVRFVALATLALFVAHLWWIYPTILVYQTQLVRAGGTAYGAVGLADLQANSQFTTIFNVLRLAGMPAYYRAPVYPQLPFSWIYHDSFLPVTLLSIGLPIFAFLALIVRPMASDRTSVLFAAMSVIGVAPIAGGLQPPFGQVFAWVTDHFVAVTILFRDPYQKFGFWIPFGYSYLIGATFLALASWRAGRPRQNKVSLKLPLPLSKRRIFVLSMMLLLISVGYAWPMLTGDLIPQQTTTLPSGRISVPQYYYEAANWLQLQEGDFRVLSLPKDSILQSSGWTHGYAGLDIMRLLTGRSIISTDPQVPNLNAFQEGLYDHITQGGDNLGALLRLLGVRFILLRTDAAFYPAVTQPANISQLRVHLEADNDLSVSKQFGPLLFFEVKNSGPRVFVPSNVLSISDLNEIGWNLSLYQGEWSTTSLAMSGDDRNLSLAFNSPGSYSYGYVSTAQQLNIPVSSYPYVKVRFSTTPNAAILLRVTLDNETMIWVSASDTGDARPYLGNHYSSLSPTNITYDVSKLGETVTNLDIFVTNAPYTGSHQSAAVSIYEFTFESVIGVARDYVRAIAQSPADPISYVLLDQGPQQRNLRQAPAIAYDRLSAIEYRVRVSGAQEPFVLVLTETFDALWQVTGDVPFQRVDTDHFLVDGFANGWLINRPGDFTLIIHYGPYGTFSLAYWASFGFIAIIMAIVLKTSRSRKPLLRLKDTTFR